MARTQPADAVRQQLLRGLVIPAHPLALTSARKLDERRQRALTRYYVAAGAGGIAVGVHTTQFAIRDVGLYRPVLELAAETVAEQPRPKRGRGGARQAGRGAAQPSAQVRRLRTSDSSPTAAPHHALRASRHAVKVAGICGPTKQAVREARIAADLGYHAGLLSLGALPRATDAQLIAHARAVAEIIPVFGFYLQPAVGGRPLSAAYWRRFVEIESVVAIKIAPFDRYRTLDVLRAVAESGRAGEIALYTGNDDNIVADLVTPYVPGEAVRRARPRPAHPKRQERGHLASAVWMVGGLLGHWAYWTQRAVMLHAECRRVSKRRGPVPPLLLALGGHTTDANAAIFDAANGYRGCIPGIHEILRRQGLLAGRWCLDRAEDLSPGQLAAIDRVCRAYPELADDDFVAEHRDEWLR